MASRHLSWSIAMQSLYEWDFNGKKPEFLDKIDLENDLRAENNQLIKVATESSNLVAKDPIDITFYSYLGADHNMQPSWNTAISRDLEFFKEKL